MDIDEEQAKPKAPYILGMVLDEMSVGSLQEYLQAMAQEKARVEAEIDARGGHLAAAEALFS